MRLSKSASRRLVSGLLAGAALTTAHSAFGQVYFEESFNTGFFASLPADWVIQNNSRPIGLNSWFQGFPDNFPSFNGTPDAYASVNFNSGAGTAEINNWMVTPVINAPAGSRVSFVTRNPNNVFPDRLELRSSNGSTNVGSTSSDFGDFDNLLLSIDPDLLGVYPTSWTRFEVTLPSAFSGRLGFRYWVTDGGPSGANSNLIGIDALHVSDPSEPLPEGNPPPGAPTSIAALAGGSLTGNLSEIGEVDWYKFDWSGGAFTINTNGSTLSGDNDTELGLYTATGELVTSNDDSGDGFLSLINLPNLNAGTYYVAVGGWNMTFGAADWQVSSSGASADTGTYVINGLSLAPNPIVAGDFGGAESPDGSLNTPDGEFNEFDVEGFLLALNDQAAYLTLNPTLGDSLTGRGDFGGNESTDGSLNTPDGSFNEFDVEGFLLALNDPAGYAAIQPAGRIAAIPEPAALGLLAPMGLLLSRRRR